MSASTSDRKYREAGFTLAEALAALVILALAIGQISELMGQFVRTIRETRGTVAATTSLLTQFRRANVAGANRGEVTIDEEVFVLGADPETQGQPCLFDATGRRCR